ncbi:hypothetical protein JTB14_014795 [Gonioctena quinquepunctata]|nr:hypothetical protein JTB14_014795 [Gonioctena quinquepunctata]
MGSTDSGMVQIEIDGLIITVDRETVRMLPTGSNYLEGRKKIDTDIPVPVWKTSKNQTDRDRETTKFFLDLRKNYDKEFADKTTNKNSVWAQIGKIMDDNGFFVGDGIDGREKYRQKFSNIQASYIKYVDKRKQTGEGKIVKPPSTRTGRYYGG